MEKRFRERIKKIRENYPEKVRGIVRQMEQELSRDVPFSARLKNIYIFAHDLKGQSGTLGYDLAGEVAACLSVAIVAAPGRLEDEPEILTMHLNAILWALENEGNGAAEVEKKTAHPVASRGRQIAQPHVFKSDGRFVPVCLVPNSLTTHTIRTSTQRVGRDHEGLC